MNTTTFLQTFGIPFRHSVLFLAAIVFWMIGAFGLLIQYALRDIMPFVGSLGLTLVFAFMVPAFIGYLVQIVDASSRKLEPPVADAELFMMLGRDWRLFPLLPVAALSLVHGAIAPWSSLVATALVLCLAVFLLPLHLMLFAVTGSRSESLNPMAMQRLLRRLWPEFGWLMPALIIMTLLAGLAWQFGWPSSVKLALILYLSMVFALLCGRLLTIIDIGAETDIGAIHEPSAEQVDAASAAERNKVLNHAYGLISRGNREGGFGHIDEYLDAHTADAETALWFYFSMQAWDLSDVPLFYGQGLISRLLDQGENAAAMKVLASCLHKNESFRPHATDRGRLQQIAEQTNNGELGRALARMP